MATDLRNTITQRLKQPGVSGWLMILALGFALYIRVLHIHLPYDRDEGEYAYAAQSILRGDVPYVDFANMKWPGLYYIYAGIFGITSADVENIRAASIVVFLLSALFIFLIACRIWSAIAARYAVILFTMMQTSLITQGLYANAEIFVQLFGWLAVVLLIYPKEKKIAHAFLAGLSVGIAVLIKQQGFGFILLTAGSILLFWPRDRFIKSFLSWASGGMCIALVIVGILYAQGALQAAYDYSIVYARAYSGLVDGHVGWYLCKTSFGQIWQSIYPIVILGVIGIVLSIFDIHKKTGVWLMMACLSMALAVIPGLYFRIHYFIFLYPVIALAGGYALHRMSDWQLPAYPVTRYTAAVCIIAAGFLYQQVPESLRWSYQLDSKSLTRKIHGWSVFQDAPEIGSFIRDIAGKDDRMGMIGNEPELYVYSGLRAATDLMFTYPLLETSEMSESLLANFINDLETSAPEIMVTMDVSDTGPNKKNLQTLDTWWSNYKVHYDSVTTFCTNNLSEPYSIPNDALVDCGKRTKIVIYTRK